MNHILLASVLLGSISILSAQSGHAGAPDGTYSDPILKKLVHEVESKNKPFSNLKELDAIGARVSGSENAEKAVAWGKKKMESYHFDRVTLEPCEVPKWSRGNHEKVTVTFGDQKKDLKVAALGGSIGTGKDGVLAEVIEVNGTADIEKVKDQVKGKIVFFNQAMDVSHQDSFQAYSKTAGIRVKGPSLAAKYGAVATVIRSLSTLQDDDHPHTGILDYDAKYAKLPAAALSTHAANVLSADLKTNPHLQLKLELSASDTTTVKSYSVVGDLIGSEFPHEVFLIGGHLDSWDLGRGNHDDGAGVVESLEVVRALKALKIKPKRTIRVVLFMTEEFGGYGAEQYEKRLLADGRDKIIGAMESDRGGFAPTGFSAHVSDEGMKKIQAWKPDLANVHADEITPTSRGGTDTETLGLAGVPEFEIIPVSTHYFDFHHSALDQLANVVPKDLDEAAAAMTLFSYLVAEHGI